jgi:hypothetical protein
MALTGPSPREAPYFSDALLKVIFAHSARFLIKPAQEQGLANELMDNLTNQAHFSLGMTLTNPSSIPTIQALLQQSGREVAFGRSSQGNISFIYLKGETYKSTAWLYSGMAFRMAIDLGIHLPSDKLKAYVKTLTAEDIEIRKRLFWSCYTWDKAISLYLGRMPGFVPPIDSKEPVFMDDFTENDPWEPYYGFTEDPARIKTPYPPTKGRVISCFTALCRLSIILSTIMLEIYGPSLVMDGPEYGSPRTPTKAVQDRLKRHSMKNSAFIKVATQLQEWSISLSDNLRLNVEELPALSPPPHIVSLNLLYHTTIILLHRPFILGTTDFANPAVSRSYHICMIATAAIHDLLGLLTRTFGYAHVTYLTCYSAYIAATIAVLHFQLEEEPALSKPDLNFPKEKLGLKFFLGVLQKTGVGMPALERSVEIVKRHMQVIINRRAKKFLDSLFPTTNKGSTDSTQMSSPTTSQYDNIFGEPERSPGMSHPLQYSVDNTYQTYQGFNLDGLPTFPGQNLNMGLDYPFNAEITDPETRAALMGLNLDPHLTLNHGNDEWDYDGSYVSKGT